MGKKVKTLGTALRESRGVIPLSLRKAAESAKITPTYLQKLEADEVGEPSPNILYRLSTTLKVNYDDLMALAGYIIPGKMSADASTPTNVLESAFKSLNMSPEEIEEMASYLGYLRTKKGKTKDGE